MEQRKLTGFEVDKITILLNDLDKAAELIGCNDARQYFPDAVDMLASMKTNRTTDGKPYVEPQPEIGDGYRLATEADKDRRDRHQWNPQDLAWYYAPVGIYAGNYTYRVPIDRIPTDEDAKQRPTVMVRHDDCGEWEAAILFAVAGVARPFITLEGTVINRFAQARFPYAGELD
jgi:hypothetical protein